MNNTYVNLDDALALILHAVNVMAVEELDITEAVGRIISEDIYSPFDSPPFARSAMDGFAYNSQDKVAKWKVVATIAAGDDSSKLKHGECARIMTGAKVPAGADKVIKFEDAACIDDVMQVKLENKNTNIRYQGEEFKTGDLLLPKGTLLRPVDIATLAGIGLNKISVHQQPSIGLLVTGSEIVEPGLKLSANKIFNSNGPQLISQIKPLTQSINYYGIIADSSKEIELAIAKALDANDLVIITGGASRGDFDFVQKVLEKLKVKLKFTQLAIKPGKPTIFGTKSNKFIFGLPGNPVATLVIFEIIIKPLIYQLEGHAFKANIYQGVLRENISCHQSDRMEFVPVFFDGKNIIPVTYNGSAHISAFSQANGLIALTQNLSKGEVVSVRSL